MSDLDPDEVLRIVIGALIAVHIAIGIISGRIAAAKGRDPLLGFLTGLLLNVLGLIIVMLMRPSVEAEARRRVAVDREYKRVRSTRPSLPQSGYRTEDRGVVRIQRASDSVEIRLPVTVLATPEDRALGLDALRDPTHRGVLHSWPEVGVHRVAFWNTLDVEVCVLALDAKGVMVEVLTLLPHDDDDVYPAKPIAYAIAVPKERFDALGVNVGDRFIVPRELRPLVWRSLD